MNTRPITLAVKRGAFRADSPHPPQSDTAYKQARARALRRDDFTCQFCGFKHEKNEVHHANDDHEDHSDANLVTACVLCHMCHHLGFAGIQNRGKLIYLPETTIDQAGLNQVVRMLWVAEAIGKGDLKNTATSLLSRLDRACIAAKTLLGTSEPAILGDYLAGLPVEQYAERQKALDGIYLLPKKESYLPYLKLWVEGSKSYRPEDWVDTARKKFADWRPSD